MKDFKDAMTHRLLKFPINGFAPGNYLAHCLRCDGRFMGMDKRAIRCFPCAVEELAESHRKQAEKLAMVKGDLAVLTRAREILAMMRKEGDAHDAKEDEHPASKSVIG